MPFILIPISFLFILSSTNPANAGPVCPPRTCNGLTIRTPFWITEPRCGRLGFNLTCHNEKPAIKINGQDFLIRNIFYGNNSFLLAKLDMFDQSNTCPTPRLNFTVGGTPFRYGPATSDLFFFYNCTEPFGKQTYTVDCASGHSFAVFHVDLLRHWNYSVESCRPPVNAPVADGGLDELLAMNYTTILEKGFVLQWDEQSGGGLNSRQKIEIGVVASAICAVVACVTTFYIHRIRRRKHRGTSSFESSPHPSFSKDLEKIGIRVFDHRELEEATDHFNPKSELGDGGYGAVYRGTLRDGRAAAVKRLFDNHDRRVEQFVNEVNILARLRHPNLVSLYGSTSPHSRGRDLLLLVYEYVPNGTLADHLHGPRAAEPEPLPWARRLNIALETASALTFLHASGVVHRDVKSGNILLDESFVVKVADFGLSRLFPAGRTHVSTGPQGTPGYVDPEYSEVYELTEKSDVYSFGVVLVELVSSKMAVDVTRGRGEVNLSTMALAKIQGNALHELVDPEIGFDSDFEVRSMIVGVAELAFRCLQSTKESRPGMREVLSVLEEIKSRDYSRSCVVDVPADDVVLLRNC